MEKTVGKKNLKKNLPKVDEGKNCRFIMILGETCSYSQHMLKIEYMKYIDMLICPDLCFVEDIVPMHLLTLPWTLHYFLLSQVTP